MGRSFKMIDTYVVLHTQKVNLIREIPEKYQVICVLCNTDCLFPKACVRIMLSYQNLLFCEY